jgi:hypothetical protein
VSAELIRVPSVEQLQRWIAEYITRIEPHADTFGLARYLHAYLAEGEDDVQHNA